MNILPLFWENSCVIHLKVVVFPEPFGPNIPKHSPSSKQKFKFFIAVTSFFLDLQHNIIYSYIFLKFCILIAYVSSSFILSFSSSLFS